MRKFRLGLLASAAVLPATVMAQDGVVILAPIEVINISPLLGSGVDPNKVPSAVQVLGQDKVLWHGVPSALKSLQGNVGGVTLNQAQNNPFQPNFMYRGFEASPLQGNGQGLAVYVNGSRFNSAFGDTTNWDLIPDVAIGQMNIEGSNPVFGLNALGGSLAVQMKNGFTWQGAEATISGGSFGRINGNVQFGRDLGAFSIYLAANALHEKGWRDHSPSTLMQVFSDVGFKSDGTEIHLDLIAANNDLTGNGTSPVELIAVNPRAVFTYPDQTLNQYLRANLTGNTEINDWLSLQAAAYVSYFQHSTRNGDGAEIEPCDFDDDILCSEDGDVITDTNGNPIPNFNTNSPYKGIPDFAGDFAEGGPYAVMNRTNARTVAFGGSAQLTSTHELFQRPNQFVIGASFDGGITNFDANTELGSLGLDRGFVPGGGNPIIDTDEIQPVNVITNNSYVGAYFANTLDVTDRLALTLSGRLNFAHVVLQDQIGTALNGDHTFIRFNPGVGASYQVMDGVSVYAGYSESNRAPTPAELTCADPDAPCSLAAFFVGDPPLKQVVSRTIEAGIRGTTPVLDTGELQWRLGVFRTQNQDDIIFVASPTIGRGYFTNIGGTLRQGVEAGARLTRGKFSVFADYAFTDATYLVAADISSPRNPAADADGIIHVAAGDRLTAIPMHSVKFGVDYDITPKWTVGLNGRAASGMFLFGDESNQNPMTRPYVVFDVSTSYKVTDHLELFASIENLFNTQYETFGTFSETGEVPIVEVPGASDPRALSLGAPFAVYGGLKLKF